MSLKEQKTVDKYRLKTYSVHIKNKRKEKMHMSDKDKKILETLAKAVTGMSEFEKGYILGVGENIIKQREEREKEDKKTA